MKSLLLKYTIPIYMPRNMRANAIYDQAIAGFSFIHPRSKTKAQHNQVTVASDSVQVKLKR